MIDIYQFKQINDSYGHTFGDQVIRKLARVIEREVRVVDITGRIGGDEFAAILPETSIKNASILAERLLNSLSGISIAAEDKTLSVSASIGVAEHHADDANVEAVLLRADRALYRAKSQGRNQFVRA